MGDFFKNMGNSKDKSYSYTDQIKSPEEIGMSGRGDLETLGKDIAGLIAYTEILVEGGGKASRVNGPLGDKYFLKTGALCKDVDTGKRVTRSIFINNIPDGSVPFISSGVGIKFTTFEGLIPGLLNNLSDINPMAIFSAFTTSGTPKCKAITLETRDVNNNTNYQTAFMTLDDIKSERESFTNKNLVNKSTTNFKNSNYSDIITYLYYTSVLCLVIYIISRIKN